MEFRVRDVSQYGYIHLGVGGERDITSWGVTEDMGCMMLYIQLMGGYRRHGVKGERHTLDEGCRRHGGVG